MEPANPGDTAHRTPHTDDPLPDSISAGQVGDGDGHTPHTAPGDAANDGEEAPPPAPETDLRDRIVAWLRKECRPPVTWSDRPAAPAELLEYARTAAPVRPGSKLHKAGIQYQYWISIPATYVLYAIADQLQRPGRAGTLLAVLIVIALAVLLG